MRRTRIYEIIAFEDIETQYLRKQVGGGGV